MRRIDYLSLLRSEGIPFVDRGKNVKRGHINIKCPFCGSADPSYHMGLELETGYWGCWRNAEHRGKSPVRLLVQLLRIPYWRARELAGLDADAVDPEGFTALAVKLRSGAGLDKSDKWKPKALEFPEEFRPLELDDRKAWPLLNYLDHQRGFSEGSLAALAYDYNLMFAPRGPWYGRLILPYYLQGALVTWTGRTTGHSDLRYRDLDIESSVVPPKHTLYNYDATLDGGNWLFVVEGPLDALKLDFYGSKLGCRAVGLSTNSISDEQLWLLAEAQERFEHVGVMMDNATTLGFVDSMRMRQALRAVAPGAIFTRTPGGQKDAAAASPQEITTFLKNLL